MGEILGSCEFADSSVRPIPNSALGRTSFLDTETPKHRGISRQPERRSQDISFLWLNTPWRPRVVQPLVPLRFLYALSRVQPEPLCRRRDFLLKGQPFNPIAKQRRIEVEQKPCVKACVSQVGQHLRFVNLDQLLDCLDLHQHPFLDDDVNPITDAE